MKDDNTQSKTGLHYSYRISNTDQLRKNPGARGRKARKSNPEKIGAVLKLALAKHGLDQDLARYEFVQHWEEIVGAEIAKRSHPECIRGNTLVVRVVSSTWAQELHFLKSSILKRLQQFVGESLTLDDVHFYVAGNA